MFYRRGIMLFAVLDSSAKTASAIVSKQNTGSSYQEKLFTWLAY